MSSFSMDYCSTEHFDCITYYFNVKYMIEECTIYKDMSSISEKEFLDFKEEYESYKSHIFQTTEKRLQEKHGPECILDDIRFIELSFNEIAKHATYSARISVTLPNNIARDTAKDITFFHHLLGTIFRLRTSLNPKAGFFFKYGSLIGQQTTRDKERILENKRIKEEIEIMEGASEEAIELLESKTDDATAAETTVVNVKVKFLRSGASSFSKKTCNNLKEWMDDPQNVYIGRKESVFIDGERFPKEDSLWANPYKVTRGMPPRTSCRKYEEYIISRIANERDFIKNLLALKGKNLGCWCKEKGNEMCHGDVLLKLLQAY